MEYILHNADFRDIKSLEKPHTIVIDPPYCSAGIKNSDRMIQGGSFEGDSKKINYNIANDSLSSSGYLRIIKKAISNPYAEECYIFFDWKNHELTIEAVEDSGYIPNRILYWDKKSPGYGSTWRQQVEQVLFSRRSHIKSGFKKGISNLMSYSRVVGNKKTHTYEKPVGLMMDIIQATKTDWIVDSFMGTGSTGEAALRSKKKFWGVEIDSGYFDIAKSRLEKVQKEIDE